MANKRIVDLETQGEIDIENLKFVLDSVGDGTKSITFKRVLDLATKQAEIKQAEAEVGTIFARFEFSNKIGRKIVRPMFPGKLNLAEYPLFKKWILEQLDKQPNNNNLRDRYDANANTFDFWDAFELYLKHDSFTAGKLGSINEQSLPGLERGDLAVVNYSGSKTTSKYVGGFNIHAKNGGDFGAFATGSASEQIIGGDVNTFEGSGSKQPAKNIDHDHTHSVNIDHGHAMEGEPKYDRTIQKGNVNPKHLSVYYHMVIGVDYD